MVQPPLKEQEADWVADLLADAEHAEEQAEHGPLYPERNITRETLLAYAQRCRTDAQRPGATLREALKGSNIPLPVAPDSES